LPPKSESPSQLQSEEVRRKVDVPQTEIVRRQALREAWTFVAFTFAITYPLWFYIARDHSRLGLISYGMFVPALCAIITKLALQGSLRGMGWRLPNWRWLLAGWLIPLGYSILAYLPLIAIPALGGVEHETLSTLVAQYHLGHFPASPLVAASVRFLFIATVAALVALPSATGEEIGWRGLLVPAFAQAYGERKAAVFSGIIWAAWHYPLVILGIYYGRSSIGFSVFAFSLAAIAAGIVLAWLRLRSRSLWPAAIAHSTHNSIVQSFFDRLVAPTPINGYLAGEFGVLLVLGIGIVAVWCWPRLSSAPGDPKKSIE
jgi:uncharacterized protein